MFEEPSIQGLDCLSRGTLLGPRPQVFHARKQCCINSFRDFQGARHWLKYQNRVVDNSFHPRNLRKKQVEGLGQFTSGQGVGGGGRTSVLQAPPLQGGAGGRGLAAGLLTFTHLALSEHN